MRLIQTRTYELHHFIPTEVPDYTILSHRWLSPSSEECVFADSLVQPVSDVNSPARKKAGFAKLEGACRLASRNGYEWIWIDSYCIDKSSSAELQESINSMWRYYAEANVCYVYLSDVTALQSTLDDQTIDRPASWRLYKSAWFTRGWTLQELIAPTALHFFDEDWDLIGTRSQLMQGIAGITGVSHKILSGALSIDHFCAAEKMSWAAHRVVTREEDEAYSLLGLFDVNLPLLYGEGRYKAFARLQEAIFNRTSDHSLFIFKNRQCDLDYKTRSLLSDSPSDFCDRSFCDSCRGTRDAWDISYSQIVASDRYYGQAHDQIASTKMAQRNGATTALSLLDRATCPVSQALETLVSRDYFAELSISREFTHVAVLNHTLRRYEGGALCLLLRKSPTGQAYTLFPQLACLPHLGMWSERCVRSQVLVCGHHEPPKHDLGQIEISIFCHSPLEYISLSDHYNLGFRETWTPIGPRTHRIYLDPHPLKVQTLCVEFGSPADVTLAMVNISISRFRLRLSIKSTLCSIESVSLVKDCTETLIFSGSGMEDRCQVPFTTGKNIHISIERLPAKWRASDRRSTGYRYQVSIGFSSVPLWTLLAVPKVLEEEGAEPSPDEDKEKSVLEEEIKRCEELKQTIGPGEEETENRYRNTDWCDPMIQ